MEYVATLTVDQLTKLIKANVKDTLQEHEQEKAGRELDKLFTINQISKRLHKSHSTVTKLVRNGHLETTQDGKRISERMLNQYLKTLKK